MIALMSFPPTACAVRGAAFFPTLRSLRAFAGKGAGLRRASRGKRAGPGEFRGPLSRSPGLFPAGVIQPIPSYAFIILENGYVFGCTLLKMRKKEDNSKIFAELYFIVIFM